MDFRIKCDVWIGLCPDLRAHRADLRAFPVIGGKNYGQWGKVYLRGSYLGFYEKISAPVRDYVPEIIQGS